MKIQSKILLILFLVLMMYLTSYSQIPQLNVFISDTLFVPMKNDSLIENIQKNENIVDKRTSNNVILGINQIKKYKYIPVDQYIALNNQLEKYLSYSLENDSIEFEHSLVIADLNLWFDSKPFFFKSKILNGYSYLENENGQKISEKQWEFRLKKKKKQKEEEIIAILLDNWLMSHSEWLKNQEPSHISPYPYRRQMLPWVDFIFLQKGFIINGHINLDYPKDQKKSWILGSGGLYYRKTSFHESIAVGGKDQQWFHRISPSLLTRINTTLRIGVNSYNHDIFDYVDFWNVMMANVGITASLDYKPTYYKGLFVGVGLHQNINILPILPNYLSVYEPGILFTVGYVLP